MRGAMLGLVLATLPSVVFAADSAIRYEVQPQPRDGEGRSLVHVSIGLPEDVALSRATFIFPRAIPMGYGQQPYDEFVSSVTARSRPRSGEAPISLDVARDQGPRWIIGSARTNGSVAAIDYDVDLTAMEQTVLGGGDSSRARADFISLLGYSVFGYVEGLETRPIDLVVAPKAAFNAWPVFTTLAPKWPADKGRASGHAIDFYDLADSQVFMGAGLRVRRIKDSPEVFMAIHSEGNADDDTMAPLAVQAFDAVAAYFGTMPFAAYTVYFDYLKPVSPRHTYGFSMEHMRSATFGALATDALTASASLREKTLWRYNVAHHIAHAWIPKRCAGEGYFPFRWELAPLLDSIWFSEGFGQYAAADALSDVLPASADGTSYRQGVVEARFRSPLRAMPDFLKAMPLVELSKTASTVYSEDFRTGRTVFSRGGLLAYEMDERIRASSRGQKRLRDALRFLVAWAAREKRGFRIDELPELVKQATGVDVRDLQEKWLQGMPPTGLKD